MNGASGQSFQGLGDIFTAQPAPGEKLINQGSYGLLKKSPDNRFITEAFGREVEGWSRFNFDTSFDPDGGYGGGIYDYEIIEIIGPRWDRSRLRLDTVPEGYGEEINQATREGIAADPEPRSILAADVRGKVADVREERRTRRQTTEGASTDPESEPTHPRREQF